jgi:hypothetical protein
MNRNELKTMFLQMDYSNVKENKTILVETNYGHVTITSEGPNGYSHFKTSQGDDALQYALNRINSDKKYKEYKLVIK